jgi:hypothetical protein
MLTPFFATLFEGIFGAGSPNFMLVFPSVELRFSGGLFTCFAITRYNSGSPSGEEQLTSTRNPLGPTT